MDEDRLAAALRGATDDVKVPRDLVRHAERLGRARRSRRRSAVTTLAVGVVVLAGGALVLPQIGSGGADTSSSTAGSAGSDSSAADSSAPSLADSAPQSAQDPGAGARAGSPAAESAACDPALVVDGVRVRGDAAPVVAGAAVEIAAAPLCGPASPDGRYTVVLVPRGSQPPTALAEVVSAADGSFATTVTLPASTPPGPARLSVTGSAAASTCLDDGCPGAGSSAEIDVLPAEPTPEPSAPSPEESP